MGKTSTESLLEIERESGEATRNKLLRFRFRIVAARQMADAAIRLFAAGTEPDKQLGQELLDLVRKLPDEP